MTESNSKKVSCKCWNEWISKKAVANAGVVVVNSQKKILLLFKTKNKEWEIPSGAIDKDECPKRAAVRELKEEANISLPQKSLIELDTVTAFHPKYPEDKTDIIVTFMAFSDKECLLKGSEGHTELRWLPLEQIDDKTVPMHPTTRKQLRMAYEIIKNSA